MTSVTCAAQNMTVIYYSYHAIIDDYIHKIRAYYDLYSLLCLIEKCLIT